MDPRKQECFGLYLYGAGYMSRDDNTLSVVAVSGVKQQREHFCMRCPKRKPCELAHERKVRESRPDLAERYDGLIAEGRRRAAPETLLKFLIGRDGKDPFANVAVENFNRGHAERGRLDGLIVHSDADPRRQ